MADRAEVEKWLKHCVDTLNDLGPDIAADWGGSCQFIFPDLNTGWLLKLKMDGTVEFLEEKVDEEVATGVIEMDSDTWVGIYEKVISPLEAFSEGKMQVRKSMDALIKIMPATAGM
jgi:hypothetical protein